MAEVLFTYLFACLAEVDGHLIRVGAALDIPLNRLQEGIDLFHNIDRNGRFQAGEKQDQRLKLLFELT